VNNITTLQSIGVGVMEVVAVIDFETTGLSPDQGDRATEIAAVLLKDGKVVDRYQSLMMPCSLISRLPNSQRF
jgi:DNA polymerase III epsilon subunit-like protein